jgi:hypothetical protein
MACPCRVLPPTLLGPSELVPFMSAPLGQTRNRPSPAGRRDVVVRHRHLGVEIYRGSVRSQGERKREETKGRCHVGRRHRSCSQQCARGGGDPLDQLPLVESVTVHDRWNGSSCSRCDDTAQTRDKDERAVILGGNTWLTDTTRNPIDLPLKPTRLPTILALSRQRLLVLDYLT